MTILEAMTEACLLATGKATLPTSGSTKYNRLFGLAKKWHRDYQNLPDLDSDSAYAHVSAGTVTGTDEFDLSEEIASLSKREGDTIYVLTTDGKTQIPFVHVSASQLNANRYRSAVALIGQTLKFSRPFTATEQAYGGTIYAPAYVKYDDITSISDDVLVDSLGWFTNIIARDYVAPDAQLNYRWDDLNDSANEALKAYIQNNGGNETTQSDEDYFAAAIGGNGW